MTKTALAPQKERLHPKAPPQDGKQVTGFVTPESVNDRHWGRFGNFIHPWSVNQRKVRFVSISCQVPNNSRPHPSRAYKLIWHHIDAAERSIRRTLSAERVRPIHTKAVERGQVFDPVMAQVESGPATDETGEMMTVPSPYLTSS